MWRISLTLIRGFVPDFPEFSFISIRPFGRAVFHDISRLFRAIFLVCHLTGIPHSGGNSHFGQNINLQQQINSDEPDDPEHFLHDSSS
jgi:hypothetical protein